MSFILDALKKSESDRQRQSGPALFEVKVAPPRSRLPPWALALAALLLVNLAIVGWLLWRHPSAHGAEAATPAADNTRTESPAPAPAARATPPVAASVPAPPFSATITASAAAKTPPPAPSMQSAPAALQPAAPLTSPALTSPTAPADSAGSNPDDYAPAADPGAPGMLGGRVRRGTADGVPLYQEAAAAPGNNMPQLRLDLHVFAARPQDRFVMINMHKVHEGETLPEGVHVESITPEGALLSYRGTRFLLPRD